MALFPVVPGYKRLRTMTSLSAQAGKIKVCDQVDVGCVHNSTCRLGSSGCVTWPTTLLGSVAFQT